MFGPQGFFTFFVLVVIFVGALIWLVKTKPIALRLVAGVMAFPPAMLFGVALVNRFYGYYTSWDDAWRDLTNQAPASVATVPDLGSEMDRVLRQAVTQRSARVNGFAIETPLIGATSKITRNGIVYLPPQYFQSAYARVRFPVIEFLHGSPGGPSDFEGRIKTSGLLQKLLVQNKAKPAVLVMPDANGGPNRSTQCLNMSGGEQDETYIGQDVPSFVASRLRVLPPGPGWGITGVSEGGYCAANIALRHPGRFGVSAPMSGYYVPLRTNKIPEQVDPFGGNAQLRNENTPLKLLAGQELGVTLPQFWVMVGGSVPSDVVQAQAFVDLLHQYQPSAPYVILKGGKHNFVAWRQAFPAMLQWSTNKLWHVTGCHPSGRRFC